MKIDPAHVCVFPGRFQPFHNGHAASLKHAISIYERVVVAISNAHISHIASDPFTGGERYEMIDSWAQTLSIRSRFDIIPVPVDDKPTSWVATIRAISPEFRSVYTRSAWTETLFAYWGIPNSGSLVRGHLLSASEVRESMSRGGDWHSLVPPSVAEVLEKFNGAGRVLALHAGKNHRLHEEINRDHSLGEG